jgi:hypothetical protein
MNEIILSIYCATRKCNNIQFIFVRREYTVYLILRMTIQDKIMLIKCYLKYMFSCGIAD